jgi:hypothetical protein
MDFIEKIFGVSPDGGNGVLEALILVAMTLVLLTVLTLSLRRVRGRRRR